MSSHRFSPRKTYNIKFPNGETKSCNYENKKGKDVYSFSTQEGFLIKGKLNYEGTQLHSLKNPNEIYQIIRDTTVRLHRATRVTDFSKMIDPFNAIISAMESKTIYTHHKGPNGVVYKIRFIPSKETTPKRNKEEFDFSILEDNKSA